MLCVKEYKKYKLYTYNVKNRIYVKNIYTSYEKKSVFKIYIHI